MTRREKADAKKGELADLRAQAKGALAQDLFEPARVALNKAKVLEDEIATLEKYETDEDHRLALVRQMENGYH